MRSFLVAFVLLFALAGCSAGTGSEAEPVSGYSGDWVDAGDGRVVYCLGYAQQFSCDWENARVKGETNE